VLRPAFLLWTLILFLLTLQTAPLQAAQPSQSLLPSTTKGYLSVPDVDLLLEKWNETQLGQMVDDPVMEPFIEDLKSQLQSKVGKTEVRLSIAMDDLKDVYGGEVCLATVQPGGEEGQHALVLLVDTTGHRQQADALLARVSDDLIRDGAKKSVKTVRDVVVTGFVLPRERGQTENREAYYFIHDDRLVATNHQATSEAVLARFFDESDTLGDVEAFQATMKRCQEASGDTEPHVRWFVEPFGYVQVARDAAGGRKKRGTDLLKVLANQGFTAIKGIGGHVALATDGHEIVHRTFVYAPRVNETGDKYNLAMRMLDFPNGKPVAPQAWVPHRVTNYLTLNWKMKEAFEYSKTLVDEVAGAPVFDDILDSLKHDPNGPRVDLREGLVWHLGERAVFLTDYRLPIEPTCERWLAALEITNSEVVAATLDKAMSPDPDARRREIDGRTVWEIVRNTAPAEVEELDIDGLGFGDFDEEEVEDEEEDRGPLLSHAAFTVAHGHLMVASHLDFLEDILLQSETTQALNKTKDYVMVDNALKQLGAGNNSVHYFTRTDKAYHPTYELIRQNKMPESETLFANLLNRILGPEEEGVLREQQVDGTKLPEYELIRDYLGPSGLFVNSEEDGWYAAGTLLTKPTDGMKAAGPVVSRQGNQLR
jgi:hypothetical protein